MCTTLKEQVRSYTKTLASNYGKRLQEFCQNDKRFEHVLSRVTEITKTYI